MVVLKYLKLVLLVFGVEYLLYIVERLDLGYNESTDIDEAEGYIRPLGCPAVVLSFGGFHKFAGAPALPLHCWHVTDYPA